MSLAVKPLLPLALSFATPLLAQQQPPTGDDLRTMYCVEVIRSQIELQHHLIASADAAAASASTPALRQQWITTSAELLQGLALLEQARYRLQTYMLPRIPALDPAALAVAVRAGLADSQSGDPVLLIRASGCQNPAWLPP
ncbi:MAG: hypothetical protein JO299_15660 [Gammaproteobacteria bacterium]|nr:hypothetical protein [Gammaproteobacteria bacterium]